MNFDRLMLAIMSSIFPPIGIAGSIIELMTSGDPDAGTKLLISLGTSILPGNFASSFLIDRALDTYYATELENAVGQITPYNYSRLMCDRCKKHTHYYVKKGMEIVCSNCLKIELSAMVKDSDEIYVLKEGVFRVHSEYKSRRLEGAKYYSRRLQGRKL